MLEDELEEDTSTEAATEGLGAIDAKYSKTYTLEGHGGGFGVGSGRVDPGKLKPWLGRFAWMAARS